MNGRIYDYQSGRFLSVDPFISMPGSSQAYNPYSYVMNNPLSYTDPTGYIAESNYSNGGASNGANSGGCVGNLSTNCFDNMEPLFAHTEYFGTGGRESYVSRGNGSRSTNSVNNSTSAVMNGILAVGGALQNWGDTTTSNIDYFFNNPEDAINQAVGLFADAIGYFPDKILGGFGLANGTSQRMDGRIGGLFQGIGNSIKNLGAAAQEGNYNAVGNSMFGIISAITPRWKGSGKNPPINQNRQRLHTDGNLKKSQFRQGTNADILTEDAWQNGTPRFNSKGQLIGKVKTYKNVVGTAGQKSVEVRFSKKHGIHGFPSNRVEGK